MAWLGFQTLTNELHDGEIVVGSGPEADWRVAGADVLPRHFVIATQDGVTSVRPYSLDSVVAVNGEQVASAPRELVDGDIVAAGCGRFVFSQDAPRVIATEPAHDSEAYLVEERARIAHPLTNRSTSLGRDASNSVVVRNPTASRFHAEVRREAGGFALHSMGSAGTVMNGRLIQAPTLLHEGDLIEVAFTVFEFTQRPLEPGIEIATGHSTENDDSAKKPTLATEWVVDEDGMSGERESPFWAIVGLLWFLLFATLAWLHHIHSR